MSFQIHEKSVGEVVIFALDGRFVIGEALELFRSKFDEAVKAGAKRVLLDFAKTQYIDSSGMGYLIVAHQVTQKAGGALGMYNLTDRIVDLMLLTKLSDVFALYADETTALAGVAGKPGVPRFDLIEYVQNKGEHAPGGE
jgi:anti-sigma B factor antagonist